MNVSNADGAIARKEYLYRFGPYVVAGIIFILIPLGLPSYVQNILTNVLIFAIFAMSLDILMGYTGLFSLGHAAFFGVGGYTVAILITKVGISSFWLVAPAGIVIAAITAAILGLVALRVSGTYFLLVTFALSMLLVSIATKWYALTGGSDGLSNLPYPNLGINIEWTTAKYYYFVFIAFVICYYLMHRFIHSPFGQALLGVRESEVRMRALGYNTWFFKYIAFIVSGLFAGVAGVLAASYNGVIAPWHLDVTVSSLGLLMCIMGGQGTLWGPIIGSLVLILVQYFSSLYIPERWPLVLGAVFVATVMLLENGFAPQIAKLWKKVLIKNTKNSLD